MKAMVAVLLAMAGGCVPMPPPEKLPGPPSEKIRFAMQAGVSVRVEEPAVVTRFQSLPRGPCSGACQGASLGSVLSLLPAFVPFYGIFLIPFILPPLALGGGVYGMFSNLPAEVVDEAMAAIETAAHEGHAGRIIAGRLAERALERGGPPLDGPEAEIVLSIAAPEIVLTGAMTWDPNLRFYAGVEVRLYPVGRKKRLFHGYFRTMGKEFPLRSWAADDAALFREELRIALDALGRDVADYLFFSPRTPPSPN